jgi:hypothetical protein
MTCLKYHPYQRKNRLLCLSWVVVLAVVALFPTVWDLSVSVGQKSPSVKTSNCLPHSLHFLLFCSIVVVMDWPWDSWLAHQRTANQCHQLTQTSKRCTHWSRFNQRTLTTLMSSSIWRSVKSASMQMALTEGRSCIKKSIGTEQRGGKWRYLEEWPRGDGSLLSLLLLGARIAIVNWKQWELVSLESEWRCYDSTVVVRCWHASESGPVCVDASDGAYGSGEGN